MNGEMAPVIIRPLEFQPAKNRFNRSMSGFDRLPHPVVLLVSLAILAVVAAADYVTGYEISCAVFYLLAIGFATWFGGATFGVIVSFLSVGASTLTDMLSGARYTDHFVAFWNAAIVLSFYLVVVWLLRSLRHVQDTLERRVRERTAVLSSELTERKRLEREILVISEREQQRIGRDIHDSLCQHLTGTALAEQYLAEKLIARDAPEVEDADRVIGLIEDAISMARGLAAGLSPIDTEGEGLLSALADLASHFSTQFKVVCHFDYEEPIVIHDATVTTHLYRIIQEAVHNAIRHGKARNIWIHLEKEGSLVTLAVRDDGCGLPKTIPAGMGLRNMKYRASMIGGRLTIGALDPGTEVTCSFREGNGLPN